MLRLLQARESLIEVPHQRGVPTREVLGRREPSQIGERLQRGLIPTCKLDDARQGLACNCPRSRSRWGFSRDHAPAKLVTQSPPLRLGIFRCCPFLAACLPPAIDPRHRFDHREHIVGLDVALRMRTRVVEERPKALESLDLDIHTIAVGMQDIGERNAVILDDSTDVREREAEVAQRTDAAQPLDVALVVEALATLIA
jgi:hypothetical protein